MMKVGYQGNHGTFSEIAALQYFEGQDIEQIGYRNFKEILEDVEKGELDYAVLPVENTTTGIIARSCDLFKNYAIYAVGEIDIPIIQNLIGLEGSTLDTIKQVYSHPEALSQCSEFFDAHPDIEPVSYQDTAKSVEYIQEENDISKAAIGSWRAREYYGLEMIEESIQDSSNNTTRFLVITNKEEVSKEANKISMMMVLKHRPGALYNILGILFKSGVNILKLESRPIPEKPFEYMFYMDFSGNANDREMKECLKELELHCLETKILGNYKAYMD